MKDSRLIKIFQHLSKKELTALGKFVNAPYHNQRKDVLLLYNYLKANQASNLSKSIVFAHIFPNQPYSEKKIRYTMSFLYQTIKDFLAIQQFQSNPINSQLAVIQSFRQKGIEKLFEFEFKNTANLLAKQPLRNQDFYYQNYLLEKERYLFTTNTSRENAKGLVEAATHLDSFFIINKLKQSAQTLSHKTVKTAAFQLELLPEILDFATKKNLTEHPAIGIYFYCFKILSTTDSLVYFQKLRQLMKEKGSCFPSRELQDIYSFALNYCIKQLNAQELSFGREAFELYKEGLQQGIFFENDLLSPFNYKNIVALGLLLKEFDWVAQFLEAYKPYLEKKSRESTYNYNLAMLHYRKENYERAMELLQKVGTKDVLNNLTARRMLVCIYYDRGEFDALYSLLNSFQNYIYRKKGLGYHRNVYLNFIRFTRKLLQLESFSNNQKEKLKKEIESTRNVAEKDWLLMQLEMKQK